MPRIIISICLFILLFSSLDAVSQSDSLKAIPRYDKVLAQMDSMMLKWKEKNINDIVCFALFGYSQNSGCFVWKENNDLKGGRIMFLNKRLLIKKVKLSKSEKLLLNKCFENVCDLKSSFENVEKVDIDHDIPIYLKIRQKPGEQELFFLYSAYLGAKEGTCSLIIKELMRLAQ